MDWESVNCAVSQFKHLKYPFNQPYPYFLLVEVQSAGPKPQEDNEKPRDMDLERLFQFIELIKDKIIVSADYC